MLKFTKSMKWISIILLLIVCVFIVYSYSSDKGRILDKMTSSGSYSGPSPSMSSMVDESDEEISGPNSLSGIPVSFTSAPPSQPSMVQSRPQQPSAGYDTQAIANPTDLLPKDQNSQWANLNPLNGSVPVPVDLLQAGYQIGLDTIGQTLKNPNYQLRSDPIIEKKDIGPWMQSTIEPDYGRIPLEIGYGGR
jgi:hypothetical protein